ncbi:MAG: hypothetical protein EBZ48_16295, partial [Proteobacteria bacterium]|nr:hypothetical protein [Pseudomonadota bacterium]
IAAYLDEHEIYDLFQELLVDLSLHLPEDPVQFLIKKLETPSPLRVFIFGSAASSQLADQLGIPVVSLPAVNAGSGSDSELSAALHAKLVEYEAAHKPAVYAVCGFPANRIQARAMQTSWKFLPSRMVQLGSAPGVGELFPGICREFSEFSAESISNFIKLKSFSLAPTRPRRIVVSGGSASLAQAVAEHYGLVYVPHMETHAELKSRLMQDDCRRIGWVLCGLPLTVANVQLLQNINASPTRVVVVGNIPSSPGDMSESGLRFLHITEQISEGDLIKQIQIYVDHPL